MDWNAAIDKNREALKRVLATLVGMAALTGGTTLPRQLHRYVLRLLRPAEAAVRRLIIVAARGLVVPPLPRSAAPPRKTGRAGMPSQSSAAPALPLFDPLPRWNVRARPALRSVPRISVPGFSDPFPIALRRPDDPIDAAPLNARLAALAAALDDLPAHARRFARWQARAMRPQSPPPPCGEGLGVGVPRGQTSSAVSTATAPRRLWPLRPGRPPGWRRKPVHEVHEVLDVLHGLAFWALEAPDTS